MKWSVIPIFLALTACSQSYLSVELADLLMTNPQSRTDSELFEIAMAQKQLAYEYEKASRAISVNDAEKVYIQRIQEELQHRRERRCEKLKEENLTAVTACN